MQRLLALGIALLLSGCVLVEDDGGEGDGGDAPELTAPGGPGQGFAPQQGAANGSRDGIHVDVRWRACEAGFCANATATNHGATTVRISSICQSPWEDRMEHDGQPVQHREGLATCAAYGRDDFGPGAKAYANLTWDQRLHADDGSSRPAPEGAYTWSIVFWWEDKATQARAEAVADVHLIVGET